MTATTTQQIPVDQWTAYFDGVSGNYQGCSVTIEVMTRDRGDQPVTDGSTLKSVSLEAEGSGAVEILIETGDASSAKALTHRVARPRSVLVADTHPGVETDIQIQSADLTTTLVRLRRRSALPPRRK